MKEISLAENLIVAVLGTLAFVAIGQVVGALLPFRTAFSLAAAILTAMYLAYLLLRRASRLGTTALGTLSIIALGIALSMGVSPLQLLILAALLVWTVRCLITYHGILPCLLDLGLVLGSLGLASWTFATTRSMVLTTWVWFLCQAAHVFVPVRMRARNHEAGVPQRADKFGSAYQAACQALSRL